MQAKRVIAAVLSVGMTVGVCAACKGNSEKTSGEGNTLTWWEPFYPQYTQMYENYSEIPFYQELQKRTDVEVEFIHPTVGQESEAFGLMMAAQEYPDIFTTAYYKGGASAALNEGVIRDLTETVESGKAPYLKKVFDEHPEWKKNSTTIDGKIAVFNSNIETDEYLISWSGLQMRQDYLDKVGLSAPTTIDEWETVLTAFRDELGVKYPLTLLSVTQLQQGMSGAYGVYYDYYIGDNGTVKYGSLESGYKEFLTRMHSWYENKLLDQDFGAQDDKTFRAKIASGEAGSYFHSVGGGMGTFINTTRENNPDAKLTAVSFPVLKKGDAPRIGMWNNQASNVGYAISKSCENYDAAVRLLDYGFSDEGSMLWNFGVEGVSYEMKDGEPVYTDDMINNPDGLQMQQALLQYCHAPISAPLHDRRYFEQYLPTEEQKKAPEIWGLSDTDWFMPPCELTADELNSTSSKISEIESFVQEMSLKYVMGLESFDSYDTAFVEKLKMLGAEDVLKVKQTAYERYNEK